MIVTLVGGLYDGSISTLIVTILFGLVIAYFAIQNTGVISLKFLNYTIPGIPIYIVIVGSLLVGLFFSWIISGLKSIGTGFAMRGKESTIKNSKQDNVELTRRNHQLELENTRLKAETSAPADDKSL